MLNMVSLWQLVISTNRAKAKAMQGNNTVTLIDGQELADLVEKYELQITPIKTYTLNAYYYEQDWLNFECVEISSIN